MKSKNQNKKLPLELLVDVFKTTDSTIFKFTSTKVLNDDNNIPLMLKQKEFEIFWSKYAINFLTSCSIIYIFVGESLKKRLTEIPKLGKGIKELLLKLRELEEMVAKSDELIKKFEKLSNGGKKKRRKFRR